MARNAPAVVKRAGDDPLAGEHHRLVHRLLLAPSVAGFLLVAGDEMNAEINGQPDQDRRESDGQNVQMADGQGGEGHAVAQADHQTKHRLERTPGLAVGVMKINDETTSETRTARVASRLDCSISS